MPREATITYDQVAHYAQAIKNEGGRPNPRVIRDMHGSGSLGTIHKLFQQWEDSVASSTHSQLILPPSVQRTILEFMGREITLARTDLEGKLMQAQASLADIATENERQSARIEILQALVDELQSDKASMEGRIEQLSSELAGARDDSVRERQAAENARTELAKAVLRLEAMPRLETDLAASREEYQQADQRRQDAERQLAVALSEKQSVEQSRIDVVRGLEARLTDAHEQLRELAAQAKESRDSLAKATGLLTSAQNARAEEGAKASERIGKLEGELAALKMQLANRKG